MQGKGRYIKYNRDVHVYYNSTPTQARPFRWYVARGILGGFCNTKPYKTLCNAEFVNVGHDIFIRSTKPIAAGEEILVYYPRGGHY